MILSKILKNPDIIRIKLRMITLHIRNKNISLKAHIKKAILITPSHLIIENGVSVNKGCRIEGITEYAGIHYSPLIILRENVSIQQNAHITFAERIEIGANTAIAANVTITDIDHPYLNHVIPIERQQLIIEPVRIGEDCKIYNNAVILQGTNIGKHCVVGANSVVKGIFPDYSVIVGAPAKIVKRYNPESDRWEKTKPDGSFL